MDDITPAYVAVVAKRVERYPGKTASFYADNLRASYPRVTRALRTLREGGSVRAVKDKATSLTNTPYRYWPIS